MIADPTTGPTSNSITDSNEKQQTIPIMRKDQITKVEKKKKETNYTFTTNKTYFQKLLVKIKNMESTYDNS